MRNNTAEDQTTMAQSVFTPSRFNRGIAIVVALAIAATCTEPVQSALPAVPGESYDGASLYRSLFFAKGPLAAKIPTLRRVSPRIPAEYKKVEPEVIEYVRQRDPQFFNQFATEVQSGDRVRVANAIKAAHAIHMQALAAVTRNSKTQLASEVSRLRAERPPEAENDANVAVFVLVWVAIFVVVFWNSPAQRANALKGLTFERYVDEVVRAIPRAPVVRPISIAPANAKP